MTVDASRSCLGLGTCVGSAIWQIVDARVLLTATAPPALPGSRMLGGWLAPPLAVLMGLLRSACCYCTCLAMAQTKPVSSRAIAVVTMLAGLPVRTRRR